MTTYTENMDNNFLRSTRKMAVRGFIYLVLMSALSVSLMGNAVLGFYTYTNYQRAAVCEEKLAKALIPEGSVGELFHNRVSVPVSKAYNATTNFAVESWNSLTGGW
jgi:hypothetical protein